VCYEVTVKYSSVDLVPDFQFLLFTDSQPKGLRDLNSNLLNGLVVVHGIIVSTSRPSVKASNMAVQCRNCGNIKMIPVGTGLGGLVIPRICDNAKNQPVESKEKCPLDSYLPLPEMSRFIDTQQLKIQESPEMIPTGEIPRSFLLHAERNCVNKITPGTRLTVVGVLSVDERQSDLKSIKISYIKVLGFQVETNKSGKHAFYFTPEDEARFLNYAKDPKIFEKISKSIAGAIYGLEDIKKSVACLLFGGCRKKVTDGVNLRGDINVLLLGDPSTAKSQLLKFVERAAPIAVYTSGKGSSAAGLTASIIRDPSSGEFQLEGGAMVLADGGIVCIDEFDKMRPQDRVAIHEAMEQQTISVAKAGITTTLNSRTSVLAAANPIYGRLDDLKSTQDQIDFQTTILSRFDCIFLVKDVRDQKLDEEKARYVLDVNINSRIPERREEGEIPIEELKKYIAYAKMKCTPKLSQEAGKLLENFYVADRKQVDESRKGKRKNTIPVTVRQLEAIIRLSEAIAKMTLSQKVTESHVEEAHKLFTLSTLSAASSGLSLTTNVPPELIPIVERVEEAVRRRLAIGSKISYTRLLEELDLRFTSHKAIETVSLNLFLGNNKYDKERGIGFLRS
jgi:DNA replication licensing factor MCM5